MLFVLLDILFNYVIVIPIADEFVWTALLSSIYKKKKDNIRNEIK